MRWTRGSWSATNITDSLPFPLEVDASEVGVGIVLSQQSVDCKLLPRSFFTAYTCGGE